MRATRQNVLGPGSAQGVRRGRLERSDSRHKYDTIQSRCSISGTIASRPLPSLDPSRHSCSWTSVFGTSAARGCWLRKLIFCESSQSLTSSLLHSPIARADGVQKWSVQMYWTRVHGRSVTPRRILTTYGWTTPSEKKLQPAPQRSGGLIGSGGLIAPPLGPPWRAGVEHWDEAVRCLSVGPVLSGCLV